MQRIATISGAVIIALGLATLPSSADVTRMPTSPKAASISGAVIMAPSGTYISPEGNVRIAVRRGGITEVESTSRWEAVGFFDGRQFVGLMRAINDSGSPTPGVEYGSLRFTLQDNGAIDAVLVHRGENLQQKEHWLRQSKSPTQGKQKPTPLVSPPLADETRAGKYEYGDGLLEAITKVDAVYPAALRAAGIEGTVLVQTLVGKDGNVKDTKVVQSISELEAAAVEAVRLWKFKPALAGGQPVSVWVAVPIRFTAR